MGVGDAAERVDGGVVALRELGPEYDRSDLTLPDLDGFAMYGLQAVEWRGELA